MTLSTLIAFLH